MKKTVIYVVVLVVVSLLAGVVVGMGIGRKGPHRGRYFGFEPGEARHRLKGGAELKGRIGIFEKISQRLNLNEEQEKKVKDILDASREEVQQARKGSVEKLEAIKEKTRVEIREVLTAQQQAEFDKMISEFKERFAKRKAFGGQRPPVEERGPDLDRE